MEFGEKVKELRQLNELSQRQLAEKLDVTPRTVRGWETEGRIPKQLWIYTSLAVVLGCPEEYLLSEDHAVSSAQYPDSEGCSPADILAKTKALFADHRIPRQARVDFLHEVEKICLTQWEDA